MTKPKRIEYGTHKEKVQCTQYACLNNYGMQTGIIHDAGYPSGCCMLENPNVADFENGTWGCSNERYGNEIKGNVRKVPKECYEEFGQDLDGCSTQENEGCGRCSLFK